MAKLLQSPKIPFPSIQNVSYCFKMAVQSHLSVNELMKHHRNGSCTTWWKNKAKKSHIEQVLATYLILAELVN